MPQTSVEELTARLLAAIDSEGHVTDMVSVSEVVAQLERMQITADHLKATRLGKHINSIRRRLTDSNKSLAKRMKQLVKSWQQLLQARPSNGLPPTLPTPQATPTPQTTPVQRSLSPLVPTAGPSSPSTSREHLTASPISHDPSVLTIISSSPQTVNRELFGGGEKCPNGTVEPVSDPTRNRTKLMQLLSKVKKPTSQPAAPSGGTTSASIGTAGVKAQETPTIVVNDTSQSTVHSADSSLPSSRFSNKNFVPVEENGLLANGGEVKSISPVASPQSDPSLSLRVSLPRNSIPRTPQTSRKTLHKKHKRLKHKSLVISINLVRLKQLQSSFQAKPDSESLLDEQLDKLVVSIRREHLVRKHTHYQSLENPGHHIEMSTEHARTIIDHVPMVTANFSVSAGKRVELSENAQTVKVDRVQTSHPHVVRKENTTEHAQKINDVESTLIKKEPKHALKSMEVDETPGNLHPPIVLPSVSEELLDRVDGLVNGEESLTSTRPLTVDYVSSGGETVMLLPYVYIDGMADEVDGL